jgi:hypothetical protein
MRKNPLLRARNIDNTIDDSMRHMNTLRTKFTSQRLSQSTQSELAACKGSELGGSLDTRGCASEDESWWVGGRFSGL